MTRAERELLIATARAVAWALRVQSINHPSDEALRRADAISRAEKQMLLEDRASPAPEGS